MIVVLWKVVANF